MTCRLRQQKRNEPFESRILVSCESGNHSHWSNVEPLGNLTRRPFLCAIDSTTGRPATKSSRGIVWPLKACLEFEPDSWNTTAYAAFDNPFWVAFPLECALVLGSWTRLRGIDKRRFPFIALFHYIPSNNYECQQVGPNPMRTSWHNLAGTIADQGWSEKPAQGSQSEIYSGQNSWNPLSNISLPTPFT